VQKTGKSKVTRDKPEQDCQVWEGGTDSTKKNSRKATAGQRGGKKKNTQSRGRFWGKREKKGLWGKIAMKKETQKSEVQETKCWETARAKGQSFACGVKKRGWGEVGQTVPPKKDEHAP